MVEKMKVETKAVGVLLALAILPALPGAQELQKYHHPRLSFSFEAPADWKQVKHPEDANIYEMVAQDRSMHVMLWYTATMQDAQGYLEKMADMKGLSWEGEPVAVELAREKAPLTLLLAFGKDVFEKKKKEIFSKET